MFATPRATSSLFADTVTLVIPSGSSSTLPSALTTFFISCRAYWFSASLSEAMQSDGINTFRSRMYASLALNITQLSPATPVRMTFLVPSSRSSVASVVPKNADCFGFNTK